MGTTLLLRKFSARTLLRRALLFSAVSVAVFAQAACGGAASLLSPASIANVTRIFSVYALTGTSNALPAAYKFTTESLERPQVLNSGAINFDVAFDITADGRVRILPAKFVVPLPPAGAPVVGLQKMTVAFEVLARAPATGFQTDSAVTVGIGETYTIKLAHSGCTFSEPFYAKFTVDSIDLSQRRVVVRSLVNRNCGYFALTDGLPTF